MGLVPHYNMLHKWLGLYYTTLQLYYTTLGLVAHYIHGAWFTIELYTLHHLYMVWYGLVY